MLIIPAFAKQKTLIQYDNSQYLTIFELQLVKSNKIDRNTEGVN
jgi:hypothetical protein